MGHFQIISPSTGTVYAERQYASGNQVEQALHHSTTAFESWKRTSIAERASICRKTVQYANKQAETWAYDLTMQMGRPIRYSPMEITNGFSERAEYMISIAEDALASRLLPKKQGFVRTIKKEPLGTVLVLAPWNYPYLTAVNAVIPAIMAGNSVILKHSEQTALCAEHVAEAFEAAGLPNGVFNYLHTTHDTIAQIVQDPRISHVAFTGSVDGGRAIQKAASGRFISVGLELGGKDPAYVAPDANLETSAAGIADGSFFNSGQSCCGIERIYVHKQVYDEFMEHFLKKACSYRLGDPTDKETTLGPMVRISNAKRAGDAVQKALKNGAENLVRPSDYPDLPYPWLAPVVLAGVDHSSPIMQEEIFAPVVCVTKTDSDDEAVKLMNHSRYGLTASVWTQDPERAIRLGDELQTGTVYMNRCDYLDPALAWTGIKDSGRGCTLSEYGYQHLTRLKSYHFKL